MIGSIFSFVIIMFVVVSIIRASTAGTSKKAKKQTAKAHDAGQIRANVPNAGQAPQRREVAARQTKQRTVTESDRAKLEAYRKQKSAEEDSRYISAEKGKPEHRLMREETASFEDEEDYLTEVENLIVMGYDGSMNFERDFIGEAQDMLAKFMLSE